jgi:3-phenylpropionate/trans-cinnamate dioxygenase ferredoxin component
MAEFVKVANANEIAPGHSRLVNVRGKEIALFNIEGNIFALENACTHEEGPLAEGDIEGHEVTCPWHGARFDIRTGEVLCAPAYEDAARYSVRVIGPDIEVEV